MLGATRYDKRPTIEEIYGGPTKDNLIDFYLKTVLEQREFDLGYVSNE